MLHKYFLCSFVLQLPSCCSHLSHRISYYKLQTDIGIPRAHKVQQFIGVLADEGLDVMAGDVVPLDAIVIEVIQNGEATLVIALRRLAIIGLGLIVATGLRPIASVALRGGSNFATRSRPEPTVLVWWLQIGPVAASKVALATRGPNVAHIAAGNALLHEIILLWRLQRHGVHAVATANVACIQPVHLEAARRRMLPAEEVRV